MKKKRLQTLLTEYSQLPHRDAERDLRLLAEQAGDNPPDAMPVRRRRHILPWLWAVGACLMVLAIVLPLTLGSSGSSKPERMEYAINEIELNGVGSVQTFNQQHECLYPSVAGADSIAVYSMDYQGKTLGMLATGYYLSGPFTRIELMCYSDTTEIEDVRFAALDSEEQLDVLVRYTRDEAAHQTYLTWVQDGIRYRVVVESAQPVAVADILSRIG